MSGPCLSFLQSMLEVVGACPRGASGRSCRAGLMIHSLWGRVLLDGVAHVGLSL